jgi:hypothetical protein
MCGEIIGPTIGILAHNTHVTYSGIATALASASAGWLITNILCGVLQNIFNNYQDLMLSMGFFLRAISIIKQTCFSCFVNSIFIFFL